MAPLEARMAGLADYADFTETQQLIDDLGADVTGLGDTDVDWTNIQTQIQDLENQVAGIGGTTTVAGKQTANLDREGDPPIGYSTWEEYDAAMDYWNSQDDGTGSEVVPGATDAAGYMNQLQELLMDLAGADPMAVGQYDEETGLAPEGTLRGDPITAALLSDLRQETTKAEEERIRQLQNMGVIKSGVNIDTGVDLDEARLRAEYDILGSAAERARADRETGLTRGIDLAGIEADMELATGEMLGELGGRATLGGREATMNSIASILAALDPELTSPGINKGLLSNAILNMTGISDDDKALFRKALGITEADVHRGVTDDDLITVLDGEVTGGGASTSLQDFMDENQDIKANRWYVVRDDEDKPVEIRLIGNGHLLASWDSVEESWKRNN